MEKLKQFGTTAKDFSRNPLGIISLFIVLIYGFASLVVGTTTHIDASQKWPLVWFLVLFPVVVLAVFTYLVVNHHTKLYAPKDFQNPDDFLNVSIQEDANEIEPEVSLLVVRSFFFEYFKLPPRYGLCT